MAAVLAVLAAQMAADGLPAGRSELLNQLVDRIAKTWERRVDRAADLAGGLTADETTAALVRAFAVLGWSVGVDGDATVESVSASIASDMVVTWDVAPARAEVFGTEAVHFWDEAGVIRIGDDGGTIETGLRVLTELGAARLLASNPTPEEQIDRILGEDTLHEVVVLAAGMKAEVAAVVVDRAIAFGTGDSLLVAARGCSDGQPAPDVVVRLVEAIESCEADDDTVVRLGTELASLPVPAALRLNVLEHFRQGLPDESADVLCALAMAKWRMDGYENDVVSVLLAGPPPRPSTGARSFFIDDRPIKVAFDVLAVESARTLDLEQKEPVEALEKVAGDVSLAVFRSIDRAARGKGVVLQPRDRFGGLDYTSIMRTNEEMESGFRDFLQMVGDWTAVRPLTWGERRGLHALARLFTMLRISESHPRDLDVAMNVATTDLRALVGVVIAAGAFEPERLAAEAAEAIGELSGDASKQDVSLMLMDSAGEKVAIEWNYVDTEVLLALLGSTRWIALVAGMLLGEAPSGERAEVAHQVAVQAERLAPWHRRLAGELAVILDSSNSTIATWCDSDDALLRSAAAGAAAELGSEEVLRKLLADPDATVRHGGLVHLDAEHVARNAGLREMVVAARDEVVALRTCRWCGTANPPEGESNCVECGLALPDPRRAASSLLDGQEPLFEGAGTQTVVARMDPD